MKPIPEATSSSVKTEFSPKESETVPAACNATLPRDFAVAMMLSAVTEHRLIPLHPVIDHADDWLQRHAEYAVGRHDQRDLLRRLSRARQIDGQDGDKNAHSEIIRTVQQGV